MSSRVSVGGLPEPGRGRGGGWNRTASRRERGRRGAKPERMSLDSSSQLGSLLHLEELAGESPSERAVNYRKYLQMSA